MRVVVCTTVHHPADARIYHRQIRALLEAGHQVTYKRDVADQRESPARPLARKLLARGAQVSYHDPYVPAWQIDGQPIPRAGDLPAALAAADLVILLQAHSSYDPAQLTQASRLLLDTRGVIPAARHVEVL